MAVKLGIGKWGVSQEWHSRAVSCIIFNSLDSLYLSRLLQYLIDRVKIAEWLLANSTCFILVDSKRGTSSQQFGE